MKNETPAVRVGDRKGRSNEDSVLVESGFGDWTRDYTGPGVRALDRARARRIASFAGRLPGCRLQCVGEHRRKPGTGLSCDRSQFSQCKYGSKSVSDA